MMMAMMRSMPAFIRKRLPAPMMTTEQRERAKTEPHPIALNLENLLICADYCGTCPSKPEGQEGEVLYCATGKSENFLEAAGCNCMECPLFEKCGQNSAGYFCRDGACDPKSDESDNIALALKPGEAEIDAINPYLSRFTRILKENPDNLLTMTDEAATLSRQDNRKAYDPDACFSIELQGDSSIRIDPDETILNASLKAGIPHTHVCGGNARCSTCRVIVIEGLENINPRNEKEEQLALKKAFSPEIRLACQATVNGNAKLRRLVLDKKDTTQAIHEDKDSLTGRELELAILFSDIRSFTNYSEVNLPYDIVHVLNRYFNAIGEDIDQNGGYIDKYMGDGIMAIFGLDPDCLKHPAVQALDAARAMMNSLDHFNQYLQSQFHHEFKIGIGLHYGPVIIGNLGYHKKMEFTAIGDTVNTASRIEGLTKKLGQELLVSEAVYQSTKDLYSYKKGYRMSVKGKEDKLKVYVPEASR